MNKPIIFHSSHNIYSSVSALRNERLSWNNLIILLEGTMIYEIAGKRVELLPNTVLFLHEGSPRIRLETNSYANFFVFNFSVDTPLSIPTIIHNATHGAVYSLLNAYDAINKSATPGNREEKEHLLACLLLVLANQTLTQEYSTLTQNILNYLNKNFTQKITLDDIGSNTFFSPIYCDAVFKQDTGYTIIDYVLTMRIEESKKLLLEDNVDIGQIAEAVGFGDRNYFSRVFKKRVGCAPSVFRKNMLLQDSKVN